MPFLLDTKAGITGYVNVFVETHSMEIKVR
jgi:hypothetical protein